MHYLRGYQGPAVLIRDSRQRSPQGAVRGRRIRGNFRDRYFVGAWGGNFSASIFGSGVPEWWTLVSRRYFVGQRRLSSSNQFSAPFVCFAISVRVFIWRGVSSYSAEGGRWFHLTRTFFVAIFASRGYYSMDLQATSQTGGQASAAKTSCSFGSRKSWNSSLCAGSSSSLTVDKLVSLCSANNRSQCLINPLDPHSSKVLIEPCGGP